MQRTAHNSTLDPDQQRTFAVEVVKRLREAGHEALWAGGCVRDHLLKRVPKDYDVATNALPPAVREIFGHRRTLAIGAAFGVIGVIGSRQQGMVEVTTYRCDERYGTGHRPESVAFGTPEQDAERRDFTINGLFYDPLADEVIDYVGGRKDLERRVVRAIGDPRKRFEEDKLRMLRALRMATTLSFALDEGTAAALAAMSAQITEISAERIVQELRLMFVLAERRRALDLLRDTGLLQVVLPEGVKEQPAWTQTLDVVAVLEHASFPLVMACLIGEANDADDVALQKAASAVRRRLKLSNVEHRAVSWLLAHRNALVDAPSQPWSRVQPLLTAADAVELVDWHEAHQRVVGNASDPAIAFCRQKLQLPHEQLDPPPLITGDALFAAGAPPGALYAQLLQDVRNAQLDGNLKTKEEAVVFVARRVAELG